MELSDVAAFVAVAKGRGFREAARVSGVSASSLSEAVRRLETQVGVRLLNRTTRSVALTEAGAQLLERLLPALGEVEAALDLANGFRDTPKGTLRLNVPISAARLILPAIVEPFMRACPEVTVDITVDDSFVDVLAAGCDAGIRYDESLEQDMIAVPIGPRMQRAAVAGSPDYLARRGRPTHPRELVDHACLRQRFSSGAMTTWQFERDGETIRTEPAGRFVVSTAGVDMSISAAVAGLGLVFIFEEWLRPALTSGTLEPVLEDWWPSFTGPRLYYPSRRLVPAPLRAFLDFIRRDNDAPPSPR